jgi:alpha-D-ribose 1-methylphosphonate 5-triphosphate diphosphatase PhnM
MMKEQSMSRARVTYVAAALLVGWVAPAVARAASQQEMVDLLKAVDERQRNQGDWRSMIYMEQKEKNKVDVAYEAQVFLRSQDQ